MRETLRGLAALRPDKAKTIEERLKESGPGTLERVDASKAELTIEDLMKPPKLDEETSS